MQIDVVNVFVVNQLSLSVAYNLLGYQAYTAIPATSIPLTTAFALLISECS